MLLSGYNVHIQIEGIWTVDQCVRDYSWFVVVCHGKRRIDAIERYSITRRERAIARSL
eukprot:COSAG05_NODE_23496_length_257_cov_1.316456_1_plen_57_part_10